MELKQLQALSDAQKDRYQALGRLFEHPSYKFLMEWAQLNVAECTTRELNAPNWDFLLLQRGARMAYQNLVNLESITEAEFEVYANDALEEQAAAEYDKQTKVDDLA
jgi:hypothetical protein